MLDLITYDWSLVVLGISSHTLWQLYSLVLSNLNFFFPSIINLSKTYNSFNIRIFLSKVYSNGRNNWRCQWHQCCADSWAAVGLHREAADTPQIHTRFSQRLKIHTQRY